MATRNSYQSIPAIAIVLLILTSIPLFSDEGPVVGASEMDLEQDSEVIRIDLGRPVFEITREYIGERAWSRVRLEDGISPPTSGEPSVPVYSDPMKVPYEITDIDLIRSRPVKVPLVLPLAPSPTPMKMTEDVFEEGTTSPVEPDWELYSNGRTYPEEPLIWSMNGYSWEDKQRYGHYSMIISPFDYDPTQGTLTYYKEMELVLTVGDDEPTLEEFTGSTKTRSNTRDVDTPDQIDPGTELLVITKSNFIDDLEQYIEWKREKGLCVTIVGQNQVEAEYSSMDGASALWQYIRDTYFGDGQNLKYVVLAGEVQYVPTRMAKDLDPYGSEPDKLPADTYFACLDYNYRNWDHDGDGNWAERGDIRDPYPEVYVSRISLDSETKALNWAKKVVRYEKSPQTGSWANKAGLFGSTTHYNQDGPMQCEYLWNNYINDFNSVPARYYSAGSVQQSTGASYLTYGNIQNAFEDGLSTVTYMGHGLAQIWSEGTQQSSTIIYTVNEANSLQQNPVIPFITAMSCETNWYDDSRFEAISEGFTENPRGGAIAYVGASRTTEGGIGYNEYLPGAPGIQEDVLRMIKQGKRSTAEIFHEAKSYYYEQWEPYFNSYEFAYNAWVEHNLLGPAETEVWTSSPKTLNAVYDFERDHYTNFTVTVKNGQGNPVQGATVVVYSKSLEQRSIAKTNSMGSAKVPFVIPETAYGKLTVIKEGYKPFQDDSLLLRDTTPPETEVLKEIPNPNGANNWYTIDPRITFTCSEPSDITFRWNTGNTYTYRERVDIPPGENTLEYWAEDLSGNVEDKRSMDIKYDLDIPVTNVQVNPEEPDGLNEWYNTAPEINITMEQSQGSPQWVEYWWNRGSEKRSNGTVYGVEGDNELHIQAVDEAGNRGEEIVLNLKVDSIIPVTTVFTDGVYPNERGWYTAPMSVELQVDDRRTDTYYKWSETGEWSRYGSDLTPPQGNNTLYYYSEDAHGNRETVKEFPVPYDISAPVLDSSVSPASPDGQSGWYKSEPRVTFDVMGDEPTASIYYWFGEEQPQEYSFPIDIPEGETVIRAFSEDEAGNRGSTLELEFKVDLQSDSTTSFVNLAPNDEGWYSDLPRVTLLTEDDSTIYFSWQGDGVFQPYGGAIYPPGEEGVFDLYYYSVDRAGNEESIRSLSLLVDSKAPVPKINSPAEADAGTEVEFDLSGTTDGVEIEAYFIDFGDGTDSGWVEEPLISHTYDSGGTYNIEVKARDAVGHESKGVEKEIVVQDSGMNSFVESVGGTGGVIGISALIIVLILAILVLVLLLARSRYNRTHPHQHTQPHSHPHPGLHPHHTRNLPPAGLSTKTPQPNQHTLGQGQVRDQNTMRGLPPKGLHHGQQPGGTTTGPAVDPKQGRTKDASAPARGIGTKPAAPPSPSKPSGPTTAVPSGPRTPSSPPPPPQRPAGIPEPPKPPITPN